MPPSDRIDVIRQTIKWVVYALLLVNWGYYLFDDWRVAQHTVTAGDSIGEWMNAYATSFDEFAWFTMLFLFEAETYWLSEAFMTRVKRLLFVLIRFACYAFLAHTVYAYIFNLYELNQAVALPNVMGPCDIIDQHYSFLRNIAYTAIDANNCGSLSIGGELLQIGGDQVVTDPSGQQEMQLLYSVDIVSAIVWLAVVLVIELVVFIQEKGISEGPWIDGTNLLTIVLYAVLIGTALIWAWKGHWVYAWDQLLWIGGFAAIEMNLSEWREEITVEAAQA